MTPDTARRQTLRAIRDGVLVRQPCEVCRGPSPRPYSQRVEAHHDDYDKPLDVRWFCVRHHRRAHGRKVLSMKAMSKDAERIKRLVDADPDLTAKDIALALGLSTQKVYQLINALENRGELDMKEPT